MRTTKKTATATNAKKHHESLLRGFQLSPATHATTVELLLAAPNPTGQAVVRRALRDGLLQPDLDMTGVVGRKSDLLLSATYHDAVGVLRTLVLEKGLDPCKGGGPGEITPFHFAVGRGAAVALFFINECRIDLNVRGPGGGTPLMLACSLPVGPVIRALVARGADVNAVDDEGASALRYAIEDFKNEAAALFLLTEGGAAWEDGPGRPVEQSLLCVAARKGMARVVKFILRRARPTKEQADLVVRYAHERRHSAVQQVLRDMAAGGKGMGDVVGVVGGGRLRLMRLGPRSRRLCPLCLRTPRIVRRGGGRRRRRTRP